jgi:lipopolysaccharide/colanic/teichoic acid biosynthesis glycosyltransferase
MFRSLNRNITIKRGIDLLVATTAIVLLLPLLLVIAAAIRATQGSPVLFRQMRPGLKSELFELHKFRTMSDERDSEGLLRRDEQRLTRLGRILRRTSLDELPELWNIIKGDMSLVGPRPLLVEYLPLYSPDEVRRHQMRPGITGLAQVSGRNMLGWETRFKLDVWYIDNWSLSLDLKILFRTCIKVLKMEGISSSGSATMEPYRG